MLARHGLILDAPAVTDGDLQETRAVVGAAMHPDPSAVVGDLGGEPDGFTARRLTASMVALGLDAPLTTSSA